MTFTTPCFVRVENPEKRKELIEWLEGIGYHVCSCCLFDGWNTLHCRGINRLKIAYEVHGICDYDEETRYSIDQFKAENADSKHPAIDCGENIELFKALAAMNDENYYYQWFATILKPGYIVLNNSMNDNQLFTEPLFRKATAEEIVEYFKNKE